MRTLNRSPVLRHRPPLLFLEKDETPEERSRRNCVCMCACLCLCLCVCVCIYDLFMLCVCGRLCLCGVCVCVCVYALINPLEVLAFGARDELPHVLTHCVCVRACVCVCVCVCVRTSLHFSLCVSAAWCVRLTVFVHVKAHVRRSGCDDSVEEGSALCACVCHSTTWKQDSSSNKHNSLHPGQGRVRYPHKNRAQTRTLSPPTHIHNGNKEKD